MARTKNNAKGIVDIHDRQTTATQPCQDCPWRTANHGRRHPGGFFRKDNLRRLWNQIRKGGGMQTCHPTDPSHPDHRKYAGAKEGSATAECIGSVVLITRELRHAAKLGGQETLLEIKGTEQYLKESKKRRGLTRAGLLWAAAVRKIPAPFGAGIPMPPVTMALLHAEWIGRPDEPNRPPVSPKVKKA